MLVEVLGLVVVEVVALGNDLPRDGRDGFVVAEDRALDLSRALGRPLDDGDPRVAERLREACGELRPRRGPWRPPRMNRGSPAS